LTRPVVDPVGVDDPADLDHGTCDRAAARPGPS
jgi:hypothetical protein